MVSFWLSAHYLDAVDEYLGEYRTRVGAQRSLGTPKKELPNVALEGAQECDEEAVAAIRALLGIEWRLIFGEFNRFKFSDPDQSPSVNYKFTPVISSGDPNVKLAKISLLRHTFNVIGELRQEWTTGSDSTRAYHLRYALLHDIGKSKQMCNAWRITLDQNHDVRGALLIRRVFIPACTDKGAINQYTAIANFLHDKGMKLNPTPSDIASAVMEADMRARRKEFGGT